MNRNNTRYKMAFWTVWLFAPLLLKKYSYKTDHLPKLDEPFLMVANHTTEADFLMATRAAGRLMTFVCGEHLLRGRVGKLMKRFVDSITVPKGASSTSAVKEILRHLKRGDNVMLFPEGSRSFNGKTLPSENSLGKLVKYSGAALVTYRIQGGYFVAPRWAYHSRRGPMDGRVMHVYTSKELHDMSAAEITEIINRDLDENAYETQMKNPCKYTGEGLAEGLENYLIICPECGNYDSLVTEGENFQCRHCGLKGVYDEYGFLRGEKLPFHTVYDWGEWMKQRFDEDAVKRDWDSPCFTEENIRLYRIDSVRHLTEDCTETALHIFRDRMEIGEYRFPFSNISYMAMLYYGKSLLFTCGKDYYGMTGPAFHAWKTDRLYRLFKAAESAAQIETV